MEENSFTHRPPPPLTLGLGSKGQNSTFSEHGHVAYQIKWNHECSNMKAYISRRPPPHRPRGWVKIQLLLNNLHLKLNGFTNAAILYQIFCLQTPSTLGVGGQKVKIQLFQSMVMLHIKVNGVANAVTP